MSSGGIGGGKGKSDSSTRVRIPADLQRLIKQGVSTGTTAMQSLEGMLANATGQDLVAGFTPAQLQAQQVGTQMVNDPNGIFSTATDTIQGAAAGTDLSQYIPQSALDTLNAGASAIPQGVMSRLDQDFLSGLPNSGLDPSVVEQLSGMVQSGANADTLRAVYGSAGVPQETIDSLQATARGDFLAGGQGFNEAVDAAVRAATPGILSTFGRGGAGGATGGLAHTAIGQAGIDAFARQYAQERSNQEAASRTLGQFGLSERQQNAGLAGAIDNLGLAARGQQIGAAQALGQLGLSDLGQQADIAQAQGRQSLNEANLLGNLFQNQDQMNMNAASLLSNLGMNERGNQLEAAMQLPAVGTTGIDLLNAIGGEQQDLQQLFMSAPIEAQLQLLQAAMGGVPIANLLGSKTKGRERQFQATGGWGE
jgi:hypothetical protein